jgi:hypothetical protein
MTSSTLVTFFPGPEVRTLFSILTRIMLIILVQIFSESLSCGNVQFIDLNMYEKEPQKVNSLLSNYFYI